MNTRRIQLTVWSICCVLILGCRWTESNPVRTEETAIIACEAAYISIQTVPSEREKTAESKERESP